MKVFWSWQSDTPGKTGRHFIKGALVEAIRELKGDPSIEDSDREDEGLHVDHDVQGTPGSPDLVKTILEKVDESAVFVADVTPVGCVVDLEGKPRTKKLINANVGIEIGYALKALSSARVLFVFNEHYGAHEDKPFDLRHKGGSIAFRLPPHADKLLIEAQARSLKGRFVEALRPILRESKVLSLPEFEPSTSTYCKAAYFSRGEALADHIRDPEDNEDLHYIYDRPILFYLRVFPARRLGSELSNNDLFRLAQSVPPFEPEIVRGGPIRKRNRFGAISWINATSPPRGNVSIRSSVQLFPNGEIWAISSQPAQLKPPEVMPNMRVPFVGSFVFEKLYINSAQKLINFSTKELGTTGPWHMLCGASGVKGHHMAVPGERWDYMAGPFYEDDIEASVVVKSNDAENVNGALVSFFQKVWDRAGANRPPVVNGFPRENTRSTRSST